MEKLGWDCIVMGPQEIKAALPDTASSEPYWECLRQYLHRHASSYSVVDYDHAYLPYPRSDFDQKCLFVARSVILKQHILSAPIPRTKKLLSRAKSLIYKRGRRSDLVAECNRAAETLRQADLINVCNYDEENALMSMGILPEKIVVLPFGISAEQRRILDATPSSPSKNPIVAFVGTFDTRKGCTDLPKIVKQVSRQVPNVRFLLLGTKGAYTTKEKVLADFPRHLRPRLDVVPSYPSENLATLLSSCSVGIFPSYIEGFGLGVLEMLAASIPVIAYNVPGPTMMLTSKYLVGRGDTQALSDKLVKLLNSEYELNAARQWAKQRSLDFNWKDIAEATHKTYLTHIENKAKLHGGMAQQH